MGLIISVCSSYSFADETNPTLPELNQFVEGTRFYNFKSNETVTLEENMGTTAVGMFSITGLDKTTNTIDFNTFSGFEVSNANTTLKISNLTIKNAVSEVASVIYCTDDFSSITLTNLNITNNSSTSATNGLGGAIYSKSPLTMINTSITNNHAGVNGGAIYATNNVTITADGNNVEISGNTASTESNNAIYMERINSTLKLSAENNGRIDLKDNVDGTSGYRVNLTGKNGTIGLFGSIKNGRVNASNVDITFADNTTSNHVVDNLTIGENVNFIIDADLANSQVDTLTSSNGVGTMSISSLNILSSPTSDNTTVQVLKQADRITLDISQLEQKRMSSVESVMYNDTIFAESISIGTTDTTWDSIILNNVSDVLYEMVADNDISRNNKHFCFRTDTEYNLTKDLTELPQFTDLYLNYIDKTNIKKLNPNHHVINADGHSMFVLTNNFSTASADNLTIKNAITSSDGSVANLDNTTTTFSIRNSSALTDNHADRNGGAIYATKGSISIEDSTISNNTSGGDGGAIYFTGEAGANIVNTNFVNNISNGKGGAIYSDKDITIRAEKGTTTFEGNTANGENNAIYMASANSTLTLNAESGTINLNDKISGNTEGYNVDITGDSEGKINVNNKMENANVYLSSGVLTLAQENILKENDFVARGGMLNLVNGQIGSTDFKTYSIAKNTNIAVDVDLANAVMDRVTAETYGSISGKLNVSRMNLISETPEERTRILFADPEFKNKVGTSVKTVAYSPVYKYAVSYSSSDGYFTFKRGSGSVSDFNPIVLAGSVGQQMAYANQLANYEYATYHANTYMMLPKRDRLGMQNRLAAGNIDEFGGKVSGYRNIPEEIKSIWVRPYTSFESVPLKNGPKISSINYGLLAGGDSNLINIGHGFKLVYGGYFGYNGNNYRYSGINSVQQGGLIGGTVNIYRGNFFNTLTANVGWAVNDNDGNRGSDLINMLITGFADKFGYNIEFLNGRFILQPSLNMGYTYIGSWNYTSSSGARINTDPLHVMHFIPSVKIIGNTKNGWQPYGVINVVCNFGGKSSFTANNIVLPSMSIDPYVEYGLGVQKRWADKYSGFAQATLRSGGRRGVSLLFGFRYMLGQIAEKTANLLHSDPVRKTAIFKEKKNPKIVIEPIRRWGMRKSDKPKVASNKDSKIMNILKKTKQKLCFWYKADVSAKMIDEVYPDGVIRPELSGKNAKSNNQEEYDIESSTESITVIEKPVSLKKQFIEHKVAEKTRLDYMNRFQSKIEQKELDSIANVVKEKSPLITEMPLFKTDAILKRRKPANKSLYINQNNYKDYSNPKTFNDFCYELINLKF